MSNYAFVPGIGDHALEVLAQVYAEQPNTIVTLSNQSATLASFLFAVQKVTQMAHGPVLNDVVVGAHGDAEGEFGISLDGKQPTATYESIVASTSIKLPAGVGTATTSLRLGSCLLGSDRTLPVLMALKKAMGIPNRASAPRFLHAFFPFFDGILEFMEYEFVTFHTEAGDKPLADRPAILNQFHNTVPALVDLRGNPIPAPSWDDWVPKTAKLGFNAGDSRTFRFDFTVTLTDFGLPFGLSADLTLPSGARWISRPEHITLPVFESDAVMLGDDVAILKSFLLLDPTYLDTHPYSVPKRYLLSSLDDFLKGWNWKNTSVAGKTSFPIQFTGTRYRYELWIPVTKPGTNELIYNFYPESGSPLIHFDETNVPFPMFGVV